MKSVRAIITINKTFYDKCENPKCMRTRSGWVIGIFT